MNPFRSILFAFVLLAFFVFAAPAHSAPPENAAAADTERTTPAGHAFVVPEGWVLTTRGVVSRLQVPSEAASVALIEVDAADPGAAIDAAIRTYGAPLPWPRKPLAERPARNGWQAIHAQAFELPPEARRNVGAFAFKGENGWLVTILDLSEAVAEKRDAQIELIMGRIRAKGYVAETLAGRSAVTMDAARIAALANFVEQARTKLGIPGVAVGLIQDGKVVMAQGFGVRDLKSKAAVDADTRFLIASNTKPLTTLMLAKLVDAGKFGWDTPVTHVLPQFRLADAALTRRLTMRHLVCACTGLSRQDFESIFQFEALDPAGVIELVATMQPTAEFGKFYQYSNLLAGAAGYSGGHAHAPRLELGAAYDAAMQSLVFDPLRMTATTFDLEAGQRGNFAAPHAQDIDGHVVPVPMSINASIRPSRPDGGAFSTVNDLLRYVRMELSDGVLPDGDRYISASALHERRKQQVVRGDDLGYGMGLKIDRAMGITMLHHGGIAFGAVSDVMWFPEHGVGAVILINAESPAITLRATFRRRLLELLLGAEPRAERDLDLHARRAQNEVAQFRASVTLPADARASASLAPVYHSSALGELRVKRSQGRVVFDFGGWQSEVATRKNDDGSFTFVTIGPSVTGYEFISRADQRTLLIRDAQREYRFAAVGDPRTRGESDKSHLRDE